MSRASSWPAWTTAAKRLPKHGAVRASRLAAGVSSQTCWTQSYLRSGLQPRLITSPHAFRKLTFCLLLIVLNHLVQALIIYPRCRTWPCPTFHVVVSCAKTSERIICRALRGSVLTERTVDGTGRFCYIQATFEVVEHTALNIVLWQVYSYSNFAIPWY